MDDDQRRGDGWHFFEDPRPFLALAEPLLASDPLQYTILLGWARREATRIDVGVVREPAGQPYWYAVHLTGGLASGVAMRTHPVAPHPLWAGPLDGSAAEDLATELVLRGEADGPFGVNGMLPAARVVADTVAETVGGEVVETLHTRLHALAELTWPREPTGELRYATTDDLDLVVDWLDRFGRDADEQAGRDAGHVPGVLDRGEVRRRILDGCYRVWVHDGEVVHLSALAPVVNGIAGIGPVFTPVEHRGHGYAGWVVACLSAEVLRAGATPFLYTDQDNPVSNRLYESLGYRAVSDAVELEVC